MNELHNVQYRIPTVHSTIRTHLFFQWFCNKNKNRLCTLFLLVSYFRISYFEWSKTTRSAIVISVSVSICNDHYSIVFRQLYAISQAAATAAPAAVASTNISINSCWLKVWVFSVTKISYFRSMLKTIRFFDLECVIGLLWRA